MYSQVIFALGGRGTHCMLQIATGAAGPAKVTFCFFNGTIVVEVEVFASTISNLVIVVIPATISNAIKELIYVQT